MSRCRRSCLNLGHESLAVTQDYLADVRKPGEAKKAVADADFIPKPKVVKTGTDGTNYSVCAGLRLTTPSPIYYSGISGEFPTGQLPIPRHPPER